PGSPAGTASLTAVATDNAGLSTASSPIGITIASGTGSGGGGTPSNQPPTVAIMIPVNGATYPAGTTIDVQIEASDADGTVAKTDLFEGSTLLGTTSQFPFHISWTPVTAATYSLRAVATDDGGA